MINVLATASSNFDRLVLPSGVDPQYNLDHTVGGPSVPDVFLRNVSPPNRRNNVISAGFKVPEVVKGPFFSVGIKKRINNVTIRSNPSQNTETLIL